MKRLCFVLIIFCLLGIESKAQKRFDKQRHTYTGWWRFGDGLRWAFVGNNQRGRTVDRRNAVGWKD